VVNFVSIQSDLCRQARDIERCCSHQVGKTFALEQRHL
jgi:hypothetical protein